MPLYYKQSDDIKQIRKRIKRFSLQRKIFIFVFIVVAIVCIIHAVLIYCEAAQVGNLTLILSLIFLLSFLFAFGGRGGNETARIIKDLKQREQVLIQQENLDKFRKQNN